MDEDGADEGDASIEPEDRYEGSSSEDDSVLDVTIESLSLGHTPCLVAAGPGAGSPGGSLEVACGRGSWRGGAVAQGEAGHWVYYGLEGSRVWGQHDVAPYVGFGLGVVRETTRSGTNPGARLESGVELLHRRCLRLLLGANVVVSLGGVGHAFNPGFHLRFALHL